MKTILFYITAVFIVFSFEGYSQIKVYEDNRVKIFGDRTTDDPNLDLAMQIYGSYGSYLANGKLGFGAYGLGSTVFNAKKVYVGELGTSVDSDQLELCGSNGIHLTYSQGYDYNDIIGKAVVDWEVINNVLTEVPKFYFDTDVYANGIILNSDERFKENIQPIIGSATKLKQIRGITYNLKNEKTGVSQSYNLSSETEKGQNDLALLSTTKEKMKNLNRERIGFLADEIQIIFPDLVEEDSNGYLHVDYIGLIPVLVESIKEQQSQIAVLKKFIQIQKI